jgi:hypothetical protein
LKNNKLQLLAARRSYVGVGERRKTDKIFFA